MLFHGLRKSTVRVLASVLYHTHMHEIYFDHHYVRIFVAMCRYRTATIVEVVRKLICSHRITCTERFVVQDRNDQFAKQLQKRHVSIY